MTINSVKFKISLLSPKLSDLCFKTILCRIAKALKRIFFLNEMTLNRVLVGHFHIIKWQ